MEILCDETGTLPEVTGNRARAQSFDRYVCLPPRVLHKLLLWNQYSRGYAHLPRAFHNNCLCKIWGANIVHYGELENRE